MSLKFTKTAEMLRYTVLVSVLCVVFNVLYSQLLFISMFVALSTV